MTQTIRNYIFLFFLIVSYSAHSQKTPRKVYSLNNDWVSNVADSSGAFIGFEKIDFSANGWEKVTVPHNWDRYEGYRRLTHGNRHGYAWYRKTFKVEERSDLKQYFLFFEGVGSYATVYVNGQLVGKHAGGRTTFTLDITKAIDLGGENLLAVKADHPAQIRDLPWVCGGCSEEIGFSEGSQPMGIFRPVHLVVTNPVRVEPFGVHAWNDTSVTQSNADVHVDAEIKNYGSSSQKLKVVTSLINHKGKTVEKGKQKIEIKAGETKVLNQLLSGIKNVRLWSTEDPYLYQVVTEVFDGRKLVDRHEQPFGIRWIKWDIGDDGTNQFFLNGKPVFINGTAEYEHNMGKSHAFADEMVEARVSQMVSAGFNAFRDAHQPHNFRYHNKWDSLGVLWWTQMAAHIWFDNPDFKHNFKELMRDWVKERRNSPSIILWGLENESTLPTGFAEECTAIIREMDPTSPSQRLVTTCNGGTGTDWNVPQNWTGTYGGDPDTYDEDVKRQVLIGEYGAWRTMDLHTEGPFDQRGAYSEDRMTLLMEKKVKLAEKAMDSTTGHFQWIFSSHENPGRNQSGEAFRELDRVGPVNYKGLFSPWGEPADVYYMYRSNYAPKETEPMVYIVSHTWPNRWAGPGIKDSIVVYSNCDEVELFNGSRSLGKKVNPGLGSHFQWDDATIETNLITAVGYVGGKRVAADYIKMNHLPISDTLKYLVKPGVSLTSDSDRNYLHRVNCGGPSYIDSEGNTWNPDKHLTSDTTWGSTSWTDGFDDMPAFYASQRRTFDPIFNTYDEVLFQTFRYGMDQLKYHFPVANGDYQVDLYFIEPWYGTGGGLDCTNWRNFDVGINGEIVIDDLDIWSETGHDRAVKKTVSVTVVNQKLVVHFPEVKSGQAIISAISISSMDGAKKPALASKSVLESAKNINHWLDWGDKAFSNTDDVFKYLPPELLGAEWIQESTKTSAMTFTTGLKADVYIALDKEAKNKDWLSDFDLTDSEVSLAAKGVAEYAVYKKRFDAGVSLVLPNVSPTNKYIVFAQEAAKLEPPYDLKPKIAYDEDVANLKTEGLKKEERFGFGCVTFINDEKQIVEWPISTGVADYHAIHFKFSNETGREQMATFNLIAADGSVMQSTPITFRETPESKYREETTFTTSMINAGYYTVQIVGQNLAGFSIRGIRVQ